MSSDYDALQLKAEKRFGSGIWYLLSYTYSKSLTIQDTPAAGGLFYFEKALSSYDIPHNIAFNMGYQLPFGKGKHFLSNAGRFTQALLGGWSAQGIVILRSGQPFTPTISRDVANTGQSWTKAQHPWHARHCRRTHLLVLCGIQSGMCLR